MTRGHRPIRPSHTTPRRPGFTLVELLVAMAIFAVLAGLVLGTVNFNRTQDRVKNGARALQAAFDGARDRAIHDRAPRGIRLIRDPNNGRRIIEAWLIGARDGDEGYTPVDGSPAEMDRARMLTLTVPSPLNTDWARLHITTSEWSTLPSGMQGLLLDWAKLRRADILRPGIRIQIPRDGGAWYTVAAFGMVPDPLVNPNAVPTDVVIELASPPLDSYSPIVHQNWTGAGPNVRGLVDYRLEIPPTFLANSEPVKFPSGIVIDLDGSKVPPSWLPVNQADASPYQNYLDVMFSPRGNIMGSPAAAGLMHFLVMEASDVDRFRPVDPGFNMRRMPILLGDTIPKPAVPSDPQGDMMLVTIFSQTGNVASSLVERTDLNADGIAEAPYFYAVRGQVAQ